MDAETFRKMAAYKAEVLSFLEECSRALSPETRQQIRELVEHNEAPIALSQLAWALEESQGQVDEAVATRLADLAGGMEPAAAFPPSVRPFVKEGV